MFPSVNPNPCLPGTPHILGLKLMRDLNFACAILIHGSKDLYKYECNSLKPKLLHILQLEVKGWSRASGDTCLKLQELVTCDMHHPASLRVFCQSESVLRLLLDFSW